MPRLDNTSRKTVVSLAEIVLGENLVLTDDQVARSLKRLQERSSLLDVCRPCYRMIDFDDDVEHPPYDEQATGRPYRCLICGEVLTNEDN